VTLSGDRVRQLESHLMLFYTGIKRTAADVAQSYVQNIDEKQQHMAALTELVDEGMADLHGEQDIGGFGKLLDRAWQIKRAFSAKVSNAHVDAMYQRAIVAGALGGVAGALGGKILGAGGGGFMVLFVPPDLQGQVREKLSDFIHVPFKFEFAGSQIIFYDPEQDFSVLDRECSVSPMRQFQELDSISS